MSKTKKKDKKGKKDGEDEDTKAAMDKKKMKVLKDALKQYKAAQEKLEEDNKKLNDNKMELEIELANQKQQYNEVFEENHHLHDSILDMQQKMADEMGMGTGHDPVMDQM